MEDQRASFDIRLGEAEGDERALRTLARALEAVDEPWVRPMRLRIAVRLTRLKSPAPIAMGVRAAGDFARSFGIERPTGERLYRYRIGDAAFARLEAEVRALAGRGAGDGAGLEGGTAPALFVLWAAEWFRRRYRGGGHEWRPLCEALGAAVEQTRLRAVTLRGLGLWGRPVIAGEGGRYFLSTLAREGGFPAAAVELGAGGWARDVLAAMVAALLGAAAPTTETALAAGRPLAGLLPAAFRDDEFMLLCADLAVAVAAVRREAQGPAALAGLPLGAWLALHRPDWRAALPIAVGEDGAAALVEGLLDVPALAGAGDAAGARRLLVRDGAGWFEALELSLDGAFAGEGVGALDPEAGRLRAHAAGELARHLPGELAVLEPPGSGEAYWRGRSLPRARGVHAVPFSAAVELDLRAGERREARMRLPGGKPVRGALLVCAVEAGEPDAPDRLRVLGGPGRYRADPVVAQAPAAWTAVGTVGETVAPIGSGAGSGAGATRLWLIAGGALFTTPDGDRLRVLTGQPHEERDRIALFGADVPWARTAGEVDLFAGPPQVRLEGRRSGALHLRRLGARDWSPAPTVLPQGHYELGWRDGGVLLDRRRVAVLPAGARLSHRRSGLQVDYALEGWGGCAVVPGGDAPVQAAGPARWRARPGATPCHRFDAELRWPDGASPPLGVSIGFPCPAGIARWEGAALARGERMTLADLPDLVAHDEGRMRLVAELREGGRRVDDATMTWTFDGDMPLGVAAADLASLLLPSSIDAEVRLSMLDGAERWWPVRAFPAELVREGAGVAARPAIADDDVRLCARALGDPAQELDLGGYSLLTDANHRPAALPPEWTGAWLVYLRRGSRVLSRPLLHHGGPEAGPAGTALTEAMRFAPPALDRALDAVLGAAARGEAGAAATVDELVALAASLRGLPPATFRVLERLPAHPQVLARMAFAADAARLPAVMALSDGLPFAWCLLPRLCWERAQRARLDHALALLESLGDQAPRYAVDMVVQARSGVIALEPLLGPVLAPTGAARTIAETAQAFMNRSVDRVDRRAGDMFRDALGNAMPSYFERFDPGLAEALNAPCAAAAAVAGRWTPTPGHVRRIKAVARTHPTYFAEAFAVSLSGAS